MKLPQMKSQQEIDYQRIADAIAYFRKNFKSQPSLEEVAAHIHVSPFHFQRMFKEWAGVTPKQFLQYLSVEHAKSLIKHDGTNVLDTAFETGLSGGGRLYDLFIKVEGMTPGEYYSFADTPFGKVIVASTSKGICHMAFADDTPAEALDDLKLKFPNAKYSQLVDRIQQNALFIFSQDWSRLDEVKLHLKGTPFQIKVWETLLSVPPGKLITYASLAEKANFAPATRAVASAVARNPIAFLIPCHRVIRSSGEVGQYHWGSTRKSALIGWESAMNKKAS
jgi:AraC family transcriptional regulator of adaptative response/methylated-DNA-[protein]-cysteine methyltransferase